MVHDRRSRVGYKNEEFNDVTGGLSMTVGTDDLDYVFSHYAPETAQELDYIEQTVYDNAVRLNRLEEKLQQNQDYQALLEKYTALLESYNDLCKQQTVEHSTNKTASAR